MSFEIREERERSRSRWTLSAERAQYLQLVNLWYSSNAACQAVGVDYRTGRRWRNGRYPCAGEKGYRRSTRPRPSKAGARFFVSPALNVDAVAIANDLGLAAVRPPAA